jgi:hypothetical protein
VVEGVGDYWSGRCGYGGLVGVVETGEGEA